MKNVSRQKLVFIYNANSGFGNKLVDGVHKILSPATYDCGLCAITHGAFKEHAIWTDFRQESKLPMEFVYKNEFEKDYVFNKNQKLTFPVILIQDLDNYNVLIATEELNNLENASQLIELLNKRIVK